VTISPLPQFEEDLASYLKEKEDRDAYERLNAPTTIVVRFGYNRMVGEFPYQGDAKPGCGSKLVVKTHRGTEIGEMLTSTCRNSGCAKSVTRKEMLDYIKNSGGRKYPFYEQGKVLRVATKQDLDDQSKLEQSKHALRTTARSKIKQHALDMRLVEVEPVLGNERVIIYFSADDRIDFRDLVKELQYDFSTRVELLQVGARDEARIVADYERCGQYCCCKNFLKVLKPISMKSAKIQKATLDPLKISGRCGRLMCCLRYEDETYEALRKNLPHRKSRVGTPEGDGIVLDSQILTQLSKIRLDDGTIVAIPIEELTTPEHAKAPELPQRPEPRRSRRGDQTERANRTESSSDQESRRRSRRRSTEPRSTAESAAQPKSTDDTAAADRPKKKRRRRRQGGRRPRPADRAGNQTADQNSSSDQQSDMPKPTPSPSGDAPQPKKKRRRKRRRRGGSSGSDKPSPPSND
jgi:cell fate regulator YaaT (PSP1 superfamily)